MSWQVGLKPLAAKIEDSAFTLLPLLLVHSNLPSRTLLASAIPTCQHPVAAVLLVAQFNAERSALRECTHTTRRPLCDCLASLLA